MRERALSLGARVLMDRINDPGQALWGVSGPPPVNVERGGRMCNRTDRGPEAHALVSRALSIIDENADPLRASRLLMEWADLQWEVGTRDEPPVEDVARAVELARSAPDSAEYAETRLR